MEYLDDLEAKYLALNRLEHPVKRWTLDELSKALTWSVEFEREETVGRTCLT